MNHNKTIRMEALFRRFNGMAITAIIFIFIGLELPYIALEWLVLLSKIMCYTMGAVFLLIWLSDRHTHAKIFWNKYLPKNYQYKLKEEEL